MIDPWTNVLCVYPTKRVMAPRVFAFTEYPVFLGVLLLRCVSRHDGRPYIYKVITEAAETGPGQFTCRLEDAIRRLPATLWYRGNQLAVRMFSADMPKLLVATGQHRTGEAPQAKRLLNTQAVVDPLTAFVIIELRVK